jgi:Flp pilus assembly protein TadD
MALDAYAPCPCGSGKKFRWCCSPYFATVEKAFEQEEQGLHEAAAQTIKGLLDAHAKNPSVWLYYAQFLYKAAGAEQNPEAQNKKVEQAEEALSEALKLDPQFGMAYLLRGQFRENEGEFLGALLLYRKAAEAFDPSAHDPLTNVYLKIYQSESMLNRPVAARAALERAVHCQPADPDLKGQLDGVFSADGPYPQAAYKKYAFRPTAKPVPESAATGKFGDARKAFEELTVATPDDPAAWFNLGVVLAWIGEQPKAVEALAKSVELETDDYRAEEAGALAEVLRCGYGMENDTDHLSHSFVFPIRDAQPVQRLLQVYSQNGKLRGVRALREQNTIVGVLAEEMPSLLAVGTVNLARVVARFMVGQGVIRLSHPNRDSVAKAADELRTELQLAVEQPAESTTALNFGDVVLEALAQPSGNGDELALEAKLKGHAAHYFEDVWIHKPLKALAGNSALNAVGSKVLRKHAFGVIKFLEDCLKAVSPAKQVGEQLVPIELYDFAALRHKLGLEYVSAAPPRVNVPAAPEPAPTAPPAPAKREIGAMSVAELAALDLGAASVGDLDQAVRAALKLDARDLAVAFAQAGVMKPFDAAHADRYPLYAVCITGAAAGGDTARAAELIDAGAKYDAEHNGGARATDYKLRKAQLYVKAKDAEKAAAEFEALLALHPDEGKFYTTAAEEMLRLKAGKHALKFAEAGLEAAQRTNNRDLEGHCRELVSAAQKAG